MTKQDDMIDAICWRHYGTHDGGVVEQVFDTNPHIALQGAKLEAGIKLQLPPRPQQTTIALTELWS